MVSHLLITLDRASNNTNQTLQIEIGVLHHFFRLFANNDFCSGSAHRRITGSDQGLDKGTAGTEVTVATAVVYHYKISWCITILCVAP